MPIVDVELVCRAESELQSISTQLLADALGKVLGSPAGRTWVRMRALDRRQYAENGAPPGPQDLPAFVTVLHAHPPEGAARADQAMAITHAVALVIGRAPGRVHVEYAPAAAGRQAFGGKLVT